jgi:tRNA-splicing ligase RtcB (3'-phosphate/5'-hydroxy nucleic acid ligase)
MHRLKSLIPFHEIEQEAQNQIYKLLEFDFVKSMSIMPDVHMGYTMPIGGVAIFDNVISPVCIGYDQGCGVCCIVTDIPISHIKGNEKRIFNEIYTRIPVGFNCRENGIGYNEFKSASGDKELNKKVNDKLEIQLGTLGSGNHFIELGENLEGFLSITIHSGSRNIGHSIASHYMKFNSIGLTKGFLCLDSDLGQQFLVDMEFSLKYALKNRIVMMKDIAMILGLNLKKYHMINENHNHAIVTPDGVLHRKGATPADKDQLGIIPGNMRDGVYITKGLGNEEYLSSASHGAGRKMSRKKAKENISLDKFTQDMKDVIAKVDNGTLDESPDAYKDLDTVINYQKGIVVDIVDFIKPLINVKG